MTDQTTLSASNQKKGRLGIREIFLIAPLGNIVMGVYASIFHWLRHLRWLPANEGVWPGILKFLISGSPRPVGLYAYGFSAVVVALEVGSAYIMFRRDRQMFANTFASRTGNDHVAPQAWMILYFFIGVVAIFLLGETVLIIAGSIYNIVASRPILAT
jgi:hypothetical protein